VTVATPPSLAASTRPATMLQNLIER